MMFFLGHGYRVIAHDRRGHGRSTQTVNGNDIATYAADVAELVQALDLKNAVHIGHSTGGGEVIRYVAQHGKGRVAKAVIISAIPPGLLKSGRTLMGFRWKSSTAFVTAQPTIAPSSTRTSPYLSTATPDPAQRSRRASEITGWRQGMMGGVNAQYDGVKALSETEFYEDLKIIDVPVLVMHGEDDQIAPFAATAASSIKLLKHGTLKAYLGFPHGMPTTNADQINADMLEFIKK
jgi:non-heme chloroperoxidase